MTDQGGLEHVAHSEQTFTVRNFVEHLLDVRLGRFSSGLSAANSSDCALNDVLHNLRAFRDLVEPGTQCSVMVHNLTKRENPPRVQHTLDHELPLESKEFR
jgi:hypothetical protein